MNACLNCGKAASATDAVFCNACRDALRMGSIQDVVAALREKAAEARARRNAEALQTESRLEALRAEAIIEDVRDGMWRGAGPNCRNGVVEAIEWSVRGKSGNVYRLTLPPDEMRRLGFRA